MRNEKGQFVKGHPGLNTGNSKWGFAFCRCGKEFKVYKKERGLQKSCSQSCAMFGSKRRLGKKWSKEALARGSSSWFKKGQQVSPRTQFKKGSLPWSTGKKIGVLRKDYKHSTGTIMKIKAARAKQIITPEHLKALHAASVGGNKTSFKPGLQPWNKGKSFEKIRGEKHPHWRGGITPLRKAIRELFRYKQWRMDVFTRDSFSCIVCGRKVDIEADHFPKQFAYILQKEKIKTVVDAEKSISLWDVSNGRTLCKSHHHELGKKERNFV